MIYRVHVAGLPRRHRDADSSGTPHAYYEIEAPRIAAAVRGCQNAFAATVTTRPFKGALGAYPHLHEVQRLTDGDHNG